MKFTPEVVAALEVLRAAAENDFERHRIDVLERDLHEPPVAEQVDETHQKFDGVVFHKDRTGHYVTASAGIHRFVWQYYHGEIPDGYAVHHVDENKANNAVKNLQCLPSSLHNKIHCPKGTPVAIKKPQIFVCEHCGRQYETVPTGRNRFCSKECARRHHYLSNMVTKACEFCGRKFVTSTDNDSRFCSPRCGTLARHQEKIIKQCPNCGKEFEAVVGHNKIFCSEKCRAHAYRQSKKSKS